MNALPSWRGFLGLAPALAVLFLLSCDGGKGRSSSDSGWAAQGRPQSPAASDFLPVTFDFLGGFSVPDPGDVLPADSAGVVGLVPAEIRDLDGRRVAIRGYMVPVDMEADGTNRFVLLYCTLSCCYGKVPRVNEWIDVTMDGGRRVPYSKDSPVWVYGTLDVDAEIEDGNLVGLYFLAAEAVTGSS